MTIGHVINTKKGDNYILFPNTSINVRELRDPRKCMHLLGELSNHSMDFYY